MRQLRASPFRRVNVGIKVAEPPEVNVDTKVRSFYLTCFYPFFFNLHLFLEGELFVA